jgi:hypothetical protein
MHLLVFCEDIYPNAQSNRQDILRIVEVLPKTAMWIYTLLRIPYLRCASSLTVLWRYLTAMGEVFPPGGEAHCVLGRGCCDKGK